MAQMFSLRVLGLVFSVSEDGFHCSRFFLLISSRHKVRKMASSVYAASWLSQTRVSRERRHCSPKCPEADSRCFEMDMSAGLRKSEIMKSRKGRAKIRPSSAAVQKTGCPVANQPVKNMATKEGATRLLRKLSPIFHKDSMDRGFLPLFPSEAGISGISQGRSCQSPLIQRWRRAASEA